MTGKPRRGTDPEMRGGVRDLMDTVREAGEAARDQHPMYTRSTAGYPQWIGGPTSRFTKEEVREALVRCNGIQSHAASYLGCSYWTIRKYCERYPELKTVAEEAREILIDTAESRLYDLVDKGEFGPVRFVLETLGRSRGYVKQMNLAGHDGGAIHVEHSAREALEAKLRAMNERVLVHAGDEEARLRYGRPRIEGAGGALR